MDGWIDALALGVSVVGGADEVFGGEDAGGEEVGARARDVSRERGRLGRARGEEDDGVGDEDEGVQGEGGDGVRRGLGGRGRAVSRSVGRSVGRRARGRGGWEVSQPDGVSISSDVDRRADVPRRRVDARSVRARCGSTRRTTRRGAPRRWRLGEKRRAFGTVSRRSLARAFAPSRVVLARARVRAHRNIAPESSHAFVRSLARVARARVRARVEL